MKIETFSNNQMGQNIYLYHDGNAGVIIDAGCSDTDIDAIKSFLAENDITVRAILLTHGHFDHISGLDALKKLTSAQVLCHEAEKQMLETPELNLSVMINQKISVTATRFFEDGNAFIIGDTMLKVLHTPGHTNGGICYYDEKDGNLFTGDTLFKESIGRTDFPGGNHSMLITSIHEKIITLPGHVNIYPGHGQSSTIAHETKHNSFLT